jgi:hypothetical protein
VLVIPMPGKKRFQNAIPPCVLLRKNLRNVVQAHSVTNIPDHHCAFHSVCKNNPNLFFTMFIALKHLTHGPTDVFLEFHCIRGIHESFRNNFCHFCSYHLPLISLSVFLKTVSLVGFQIVQAHFSVYECVRQQVTNNLKLYKISHENSLPTYRLPNE